MGMTIEEKVKILQGLKNVWEIQLRHSSNTTEKEINQGIIDSFDSAIETMKKYQKIERIIDHYKNNVRDKVTNENMEKILEVVEDGNDTRRKI